MDTPYISKLIALKCAAYVKTFETTHSKECKKQFQSIYSRKKRALKAANDMAKVQLKHRTKEANANSDKVKNLKSMTRKNEQKRKGIDKELDKVINAFNVEKSTSDKLIKVFHNLKSDLKVLKVLEFEPVVSMDEAKKWEDQTKTLKEFQQNMAKKSAEIVWKNNEIIQIRRLKEERDYEKSLLMTKLDELQQEKDEINSRKLQMEVTLNKLSDEMARKQAAMEAKKEIFKKEKELFENEYSTSKLLQLNTEALLSDRHANWSECVKARIERSAALKEIFKAKLEKKQEQVEMQKTKIANLKKMLDSANSTNVEKESQKNAILEEMIRLESHLSDLEARQEKYKKQMQKTKPATTPPIQSSTPIATKKPMPSSQKSKEKITATAPSLNRSRSRGRPRGSTLRGRDVALRRVGTTKRSWETDSDDSSSVEL
uniref:Uncharacterized protein n=1 Tax=Acrobeloides nanus TaxID=290746 RepID=A0A914C9Z0_9BILA